jgi:hypothetical protein
VTRRSRSYTVLITQHFPEDTSVRFTYLPVLRATLALNHHAPAQAIEFPKTAAFYALVMHGLAFFGLFGRRYLALRGEAYLALLQRPKQLRSFRKSRSSRNRYCRFDRCLHSPTCNSDGHMLYRERTPGQSCLRRVSRVWKDADPDIPILRQAQRNTRGCGKELPHNRLWGSRIPERSTHRGTGHRASSLMQCAAASNARSICGGPTSR